MSGRAARLVSRAGVILWLVIMALRYGAGWSALEVEPLYALPCDLLVIAWALAALDRGDAP